MTPTLTWRAEHGLEVLYLGRVAVGRVAPTGGRRNSPRWLFQLALYTATWKDAKSVEEAKACVLLSLDSWLEQAGLQ